MKMLRPTGTDSARIIQVIETKAKRGLGTKKDPVREVAQYWDLNGNFLAEADTDFQYLSDLAMWESNRLIKIMKDLKEC